MRRAYLVLTFAISLAAPPALANPTFSLDLQGPTAGLPDAFAAFVISEGDVLTVGAPGPPGPNPAAPGPLPTPGIEVGAVAGAPGVIPGGLGILSVPFVELDALSYGRDKGVELLFSVDEFAFGLPGPMPPDVFSEGAAGAAEASADVFRYLGAVAPTPPGPLLGNTAFIDGDGLFPSGAPGVGLIEPNPPTPGVVPDPGDNLDAFDVDTTSKDLIGFIYFSLDSPFVDPVEGPPMNSGTAIGNGFSSADVLASTAGGAPVVAIPAAALGLDLAGFNTDDLDALIFDDADASGGLSAVDTIYFSVRRGSLVIGAPDSAFGVPIEPGDILGLPTAAGAPPSLFIAAEALGLATARSGTAGPFGADDLDALDLKEPARVPSIGAWGLRGLAGLILAIPFAIAWLRRSRRG
jgi:hypothetical protein